MNEYLVNIYIAQDHSVSAQVIIETTDKTMAITLAEEELQDKGLDTFGYDYCDLM